MYRPTAGSSSGNNSTAVSPNSGSAAAATNNGITELPPTEDPPPKYTPPPSYSTATGARIAKMLRQSFRRSVRRIQSVLGPEVHMPAMPPPPDYTSVLVEMNRGENESRQESPANEANNFTAAGVLSCGCLNICQNLSRKYLNYSILFSQMWHKSYGAVSGGRTMRMSVHHTLEQRTIKLLQL